jgi:hypothetical protein
VTLAPAFNAASSCSIYYWSNGTTQVVTCVVNSQPTYLQFTVASTSSTNYFPINNYATITIANLQYTAVSSHMNYIYQFYFRLTKSQAVASTTYSWIYAPNVIPQRNQWTTTFALTISNDIQNTGINYPNILRIVSTSIANWAFTIQTN